MRSFDAGEIRQETASSVEESADERDEGVSTPRDEVFAEDMVEEHTPRTPSTDHPGTSPPPSYNCEMEHVPPSHLCAAPDLTEAQMGTPEGVSTEVPEISQQAGVQNTSDVDLEAGGANPTEVNQRLRVPGGSRVNTEGTTLEADLCPEASDRNRSNTEASTSGSRPNESDAAPTTEVVPSVDPNSSSRFTAAFEVLGRGLLGHPMEAFEGFLGNARTSSPKRIAQSILISHYQVSF